MRNILIAVGLLIAAPQAHAFCGFFVAGSNAKLSSSASQVALVRAGHHTVMTLSNNYQGPPENFAMVVPVPVILQKENVKTLAANVFDHIDALSAPRLVEYWEKDPCMPEPPMRAYSMAGGMKRKGAAAAPSAMEKDYGVKVEAQFTVGEYEIVILSAKYSSGLESWLKDNHYTIPAGAQTALAPYIREGMKFFVAKVDIKKVHRDEKGVAVLSPLRFGFDAPELRLPIRLGLLNATGKQDLIVYVLSPSSRFEMANYRNLTIPTNLEVTNQVREAFPAFYAELFDATLAPVENRAVVTEYAWQTSSCDPCPTPPLSQGDLMTLGSDEMPNANPYNWVLTRLHARYDKTTLSDDLVFREAKPIWGGRANWDGTSETSEAKDAPMNNFQGRYIIRHYWEGQVSCDAPMYNRWGGPPNGEHTQAVAARGVASVARGALNLKSMVNSPVPPLGIAGHSRKKRPHEK